MITMLAPFVGALLLAGAPQPDVKVTSVAFDPGVPQGQTLVDDFDDPISNGYTFDFRRGALIESGTTPGFAAAPAQDKSNYAAVIKDSYAYMTTPRMLNSASVYLGSIDAYNYIGFFNDNNGKITPVAIYDGAQLVKNANGDQSSGAMNRLFDFQFEDRNVNLIGFGSTGYSFEFDNIAVSAVPEPSTWVLMIVGIGGIGWALRRKSRGLAPSTDSRALA